MRIITPYPVNEGSGINQLYQYTCMRYFYVWFTVFSINTFVTEAQTFDASFQNPVPIRASQTLSLKTLPDGKILVGGDLDFYGDQQINNFIRLNNDGSLDESFSFNKDDFYILKTELLSNGDLLVLTQDTLGFPFDYTLFRLSEEGSVINELGKLSFVSSITVYDTDNIFVYGGRTSNDGYLVKLNGNLSTKTNFATFDDVVKDVAIHNDQLYVSGMFSLVNDEAQNNIVRLNLDGSIDTGFSTGEGTDDGMGSLTIQDDGKILLGKGYINNFNGSAFKGMVRLNPDGSIDTGFNPIKLNGPVSRIYIKNEKIYGAAFISDGETSRRSLFRLNTDGSLDPGFPPVELNKFGSVFFSLEFDGEDLIFNTSLPADNKYGLSKCNSSGQLLESFKPEISRYGTISSGDFFKGKLIVAGDFFKINDVETYGIARLDNRGTVDENFIYPNIIDAARQIKVLNNESILVTTGQQFFKLNADAQVQQDFTFNRFKSLYQVIKFIVLDDGKIMAADGNNPPYRLNSDGTEDASFDIGAGIDRRSTLFDFDVQDDNKIIFGSQFNLFNNTPVNKLIRINTDGTLDESFDIGEGPDNVVSLVKVLKDTSILIGGWFKTFNGHEVPHGLVKISNSGEVDEEFLENQKKTEDFYLEKVKAKQLGNRIFLKGTSSLSVVNTDGTFDDDFNIPLSIKNLSDMIAFENLDQQSGEGRIAESGQFLFFLGNFTRQEETSPSFLVKVDIEDDSEIITGVHNKENFSPFTVYPNPAQLEIMITSSETFDKLDIIIYGRTGKEIRNNQYFNVSKNRPLGIKVAELNPGVYHLKLITSDGTVLTRKFIKI